MTNNMINTNIGNLNSGSVPSYMKEQNFFTKKIEDFDLPQIDLEFNNFGLEQEATFVRKT